MEDYYDYFYIEDGSTSVVYSATYTGYVVTGVTWM